MPALVAGIHVLRSCGKDVDGRDKPGHDGDYCAAACLLGPDLVAWPLSSGMTSVLLRFGTSPSGVNVTQLAPADSGAAWPATVSLGRSTLPIGLRSASEYSYTALLGMLVTHSVLLSGAMPMPCDGSLSR